MGRGYLARAMGGSGEGGANHKAWGSTLASATTSLGGLGQVIPHRTSSVEQAR